MKQPTVYLLMALLACSKQETSAPEPVQAKSSPVRQLETHSDAPSTPTVRVATQVTVEAGSVWTRELACGTKHAPAPAGESTETTIGSFRIDADVVDCDQWRDCASRGHCAVLSSADFCKKGRAVVSRSNAASYCSDRGMQLPSWGEWHRAIRGASKGRYPMGERWEKGLACKVVSNPGATNERCEYTSKAGVVFAMRNPNGQEWTRDEDCRLLPDGSQQPVTLSVYLKGDELDVPLIEAAAAEFRCVKK